MAQHPAMPLWTDALLADCGHLPDADFGLYLKLLIVMWRSPGQRLPNNNEWLARRFDRSIERVESELRPLVVEFCQSDGNWITQKRLSAEFSFVTKQRRQKIVAAKARWKKEKGDAGASEPHMPHTHTHTHTKSIHTETPTDTDPAREKSGRENGASGHDVLRPKSSPAFAASDPISTCAKSRPAPTSGASSLATRIDLATSTSRGAGSCARRHGRDSTHDRPTALARRGRDRLPNDTRQPQDHMPEVQP